MRSMHQQKRYVSVPCVSVFELQITETHHHQTCPPFSFVLDLEEALTMFVESLPCTMFSLQQLTFRCLGSPRSQKRAILLRTQVVSYHRLHLKGGQLSFVRPADRSSLPMMAHMMVTISRWCRQCFSSDLGSRSSLQLVTSYDSQIIGKSSPYSISGSLPLVRWLQDQGYDVQICGYGLSSRCECLASVLFLSRAFYCWPCGQCFVSFRTLKLFFDTRFCA